MSRVRQPAGGASPPHVTSGSVTLTPDQVMAVILQVQPNLSREQAATAAAVALAESGGRTDARCYNYRAATGSIVCSPTRRADTISVDRGLWQINDVWHPEVTDSEADDPIQATRAAQRISAGFANFTPWATYTSGAYQRWLPITRSSWDAAHAKGPSWVTRTLAGIGGGMLAAGQAAADLANAQTRALTSTLSVGQFLGELSSRGTWVRVVQVVGGLAAVGAGLWLLSRDVLPQAAAAAASVGSRAAGPAREVTRQAAVSAGADLVKGAAKAAIT